MRAHNLGALFLTCAVAPSVARAGAVGTIVHMDEKPMAYTDWDAQFEIPQFDTLGGKRTLLSVTVELFAAITANAAAENLEPNQRMISLALTGSVSLGIMGQELTAAIITRGGAFLADPFDGLPDFDGPSGRTLDLSGQESSMTTLTEPEDLAPWIGPGRQEIDVVGQALGASTVSGGGNLQASFETWAGASFRVTYTYIPSPGALAPLVMAAGPLAARRRRRAA